MAAVKKDETSLWKTFNTACFVSSDLLSLPYFNVHHTYKLQLFKKNVVIFKRFLPPNIGKSKKDLPPTEHIFLEFLTALCQKLCSSKFFLTIFQPNK